MFSLGLDLSPASAWRKAGAIFLSLGLHLFVVALIVIVPLLFVGYIIVEGHGPIGTTLGFYSHPGDPHSVGLRSDAGGPRIQVIAVGSQEVSRIKPPKPALFLPVVSPFDLRFAGAIGLPLIYDPGHGGPCGCVAYYRKGPLLPAAAPQFPDGPASRFRQATLVKRVDPEYPPLARQAGIHGAVIMRAVIDHEGAVRDIEVLRGPQQLRAAAVDAVRQWRYKPYVLDGLAVDVEMTITVNFDLTGRA